MGTVTPVGGNTTEHICLNKNDPALPGCEGSMHPYLFLNGTGAWHARILQSSKQVIGTLRGYAQFRTARHGLTPFTTSSEWLFLQEQMLLKSQLDKPGTCLKLSGKAQETYRLGPEEEKYMRRMVPKTIKVSSSYFYGAMNKVKALVETTGRTPEHMLTLTANEFNWPEMKDISENVKERILTCKMHMSMRLARYAIPCSVISNGLWSKSSFRAGVFC